MCKLIHISFLLLCMHTHAAKPTITRIGDPSGKLDLLTARAVTRGGAHVVGTAGKPGVQGAAAYYWSKTDGFKLIGDLAGGRLGAWPKGISADGRIVVGSSSSSRGLEAFGWSEKSGLISLGDFEGGAFKSQALAVSADGKTIVGLATAEGASSSRRQGDAFIWSAGKGMQPIVANQGFDDTTRASDVSADGSVVVGKGHSKNGSEAYRWKDGKMQGLGCLLKNPIDFYSEAIACSADGRIVVGNSGHSNGIRQVFIWTEGDGISAVGEPKKGKPQNAIGVSDTGRVLGRAEGEKASYSFLWDKDTGMISLTERLKQAGLDTAAAGWIQVDAYGISPCGRFLVGNGRHREHAAGHPRAILIDLGDEG